MINFHDFRHQNKENSITKFVKKLKNKLINMNFKLLILLTQ